MWFQIVKGIESTDGIFVMLTFCPPPLLSLLLGNGFCLMARLVSRGSARPVRLHHPLLLGFNWSFGLMVNRPREAGAGSFGWLLSGGDRRLQQGGGRWLLEVPSGFGSFFVFWAYPLYLGF